MPATVIISFDCEGKWGVADHLSHAHDRSLSDDQLRWAYENIVSLLKDYDLPATFAVVGCFVRSVDELRSLKLDEVAEVIPYIRSVSARLAGGDEGWSAPWVLSLLSVGKNEIAMHGATHVPWTMLSSDEAALEMSIAPVAGATTFIYPRNKIAHTEILKTSGFKGFRAARSFSSRLASLASEFNVWIAPDPHSPHQDFVEIPAGYFVNWLSGPRKLVPTQLTIMRFDQLLQSAIRHGQVVHIWTHPENIASAPATLDLLRGIVQRVEHYCTRGLAQVMTQEQYCDWISAQKSAARGTVDR